MIALVLVLVFTQSSGFSIDLDHVWSSYNNLYKISQIDVDRNLKVQSLNGKAAFIAKHNIEADLGLHSFWTGLNQWSHLTVEERKSVLPCLKRTPRNDSHDLLFNYTVQDYPDDLDYRKLKMVTHVKAQGTCGSCWAFGALGALEGQWAKVHNKLVSLSEQNAIDCCSPYDGCKGGDPIDVYWYIRKKKGINSEETYPYEGRQNNCRFRSNKIAASCHSFLRLPLGDEKALKSGVYNHGPAAVLFFANHEEFEGYKGGVFDSNQCRKSPDHVMVAVGFGYDEKSRKRYWIVKNSWGTNWGEKGFGKVVAGKDMCFIAADSLVPIVTRK